MKLCGPDPVFELLQQAIQVNTVGYVFTYSLYPIDGFSCEHRIPFRGRSVYGSTQRLVPELSRDLESFGRLRINSGRDFLTILKFEISHFVRNDILCNVLEGRETRFCEVFP